MKTWWEISHFHNNWCVQLSLLNFLFFFFFDFLRELYFPLLYVKYRYSSLDCKIFFWTSFKERANMAGETFPCLSQKWVQPLTFYVWMILIILINLLWAFFFCFPLKNSRAMHLWHFNRFHFPVSSFRCSSYIKNLSDDYLVCVLNSELWILESLYTYNFISAR